jgi:AbrB family looped-hinge helix DNA binding protein
MLFRTFGILERTMALVTIKDKFQVTLPAKLRARIGVRVGDLMDATVHEDGILLRPKVVVDRNATADELERMLRETVVAADDQGRPEEAILEDAIADVAAARRRRAGESRSRLQCGRRRRTYGRHLPSSSGEGGSRSRGDSLGADHRGVSLGRRPTEA